MDFTGKLGPLPVWAWGIIAVGAFLVLQHLHSSSPATTTATVPSSSVPTNLSLPGSGSSGTVSSSTAAGASTTPTTNTEWGNEAAAYLIGNGYNPSQVETALADFLAGNPLTSSEQTIVNAALKQLGSPPGGVISTGATGTTTGVVASGPSGGATPTGNLFGTTPTGASSPVNFTPPPPPKPGQPSKPVYGPVELYTIQSSDMRSTTAATWAYLQNKLLPGLTPGRLQAANAGVIPMPGVVIHFQREYKIAA